MTTKAYLEKLKQDPERYEEHLRKNRERQRKYRDIPGYTKERHRREREALEADPAKLVAFLEKERLRAIKVRKSNPDLCKQRVKAAKAKKPWHDNALWHTRYGNAMPKWVDKEALLAIYKEAYEAGLEVDHIIPLNGDGVCGLHVPWNLQLVSKSENRKKGKKYEYVSSSHGGSRSSNSCGRRFYLLPDQG